MGTAEEAAVEAEKGRPLEPARRRTDVLVIGAGLAGLAAALAAAAAGLRVTVLSRTPPEGSNSARAQGGIAAALGEDDDADLHASDTLHVGAGLSRVEAVAVLTREAPAVVRALADLGVPFARRNGTFRLGLEAGHSRRRIVHTEGGLTGRSVMAVMAAAADRHERVDSHHGWEVEELVVRGGRCRGAVARCGPRRVRWDADAVVLATGGFAALFPRSSNAPETVGSGTVAAYRAGAAVADLEFVQFHPTVLALRGAPALLLSEALRGEGAHVVDASGRRFLFDYDSRGELAPRDVLARAILEEVDRRGEPCAYLSLRHLEAEAVRRRFGALAAALAEAGLDLARDPLPILPAAHFTMGGVLTDLDGRTNLPGLLACGEAACTGVHGANRLASNSLLECLVFGGRAGRAAAAAVAGSQPAAPSLLGGTPLWTAPVDEGAMSPPDQPDDAHLAREASATSGDDVDVPLWRLAVQRALGPWRAADDIRAALPELRRRAPLAALAAQAALLRQETRGAHARREFPLSDDAFLGHIVFQKGAGACFFRNPWVPATPASGSESRRAAFAPPAGIRPNG